MTNDQLAMLAGPPSLSTGQQLVRQLGLTARAAGHGLADAAGVIGNPANAVFNTVGGWLGHDPHLQDVDTILKGMIDRYTPSPATKTEQVVGNVASTMANPVAMAAPGAVGPAANLIEALGKGAVAGGLGAAAQPVDSGTTAADLGERLALGVAGGGLGGAAANVLGRVVAACPSRPPHGP